MLPLGFSQGMASQQISALLVDKAFIIDRVTEPSGAGGKKVVPTKRPDPVRCAVAPVGGGEGSRSARGPGPLIDDRTTSLITLPAGTPIDTPAEIEVVGLGRFEVTAVRRRSIEIAREVEVMEAT